VSRIYDLVMTHKLDADDYFIHRVQWHCAQAGLNFFLVEPLWAEAFMGHFREGRVWARVLLNMHSEHHDPTDLYHRLVWLAAERNTRVIDPPQAAQAAFDKAALHPRLCAAGVPVPPSIIVPRERAAEFRLLPEHRELLGDPFVIKPSRGYGRRGVVMDATSEQDLGRSVAAWSDAHYLLQRRIQPRMRDGRPLYFRVYHVFGDLHSCWWNCFTDHYRLMTPEERAEVGIDRAESYVRRIAALTGMSFFSTEFALTEAGEFVAIDYVNDQCHLLSQSADPRIGVPDALVAGIAQKLVESAREIISQS